MMGLFSLLWDMVASVKNHDQGQESDWVTIIPVLLLPRNVISIRWPHRCLWFSLENHKNTSQNNKRTESLMTAVTSEHSSPGQSGLLTTSQVLSAGPRIFTQVLADLSKIGHSPYPGEENAVEQWAHIWGHTLPQIFSLRHVETHTYMYTKHACKKYIHVVYMLREGKSITQKKLEFLSLSRLRSDSLHLHLCSRGDPRHSKSARFLQAPQVFSGFSVLGFPCLIGSLFAA